MQIEVDNWFTEISFYVSLYQKKKYVNSDT